MQTVPDLLLSIPTEVSSGDCPVHPVFPLVSAFCSPLSQLNNFEKGMLHLNFVLKFRGDSLFCPVSSDFFWTCSPLNWIFESHFLP